MNAEFENESLLPAKIRTRPDGGYGDDRRLFQGIPAVECSEGGKLFVAFYSGMTGEMPGNYVIVVTSCDGGRTFSKPAFAVVPPTPRVRCFDPCLWRDNRGRLWLFYAQSCRLMDGRAGVWAAVSEDPDGDDMTFSAPRRIANGIMMNKPVVLKNGDWLLPCSIWEGVVPDMIHDLAEERFSNVYRSRDEGESFQLIGRSAYSERCIDEHMLVELKSGVILMLIRAKNGIGRSFSEDGGLTWSEGEDSGLGGPCSRFCIRRLGNGNLLLVNHHDFKGRNNLKAMISEDDGQTWKGYLLLDGRDHVSYPDAAEDGRGNICIVYDRERTSAREILMAVITEEDVLAGKLVNKNSRLKIIVNKAYGVR